MPKRSEPGPSVARLTRRLSECPAEFLAAPRIGNHGEIRVEAVVFDLLADLAGEPPDAGVLESFRGAKPKDKNRLRLALIAAWLLHDEWFVEKKRFAPAARKWLAGGLAELAGIVAAELFVTDADRREELARLCLEALDLLPEGEKTAEARDRLQSISSAERKRVVEETKQKQEAARRLREKMAREAAREAAAKAGREW